MLSSLYALLAAFIWGMAFVAQKSNTAGTFTFNASRSIVAVIFLLILTSVRSKGDVRHLLSEKDPKDTKTLWTGGILAGIILTLATNLQQMGLDLGTEAGKGGFLTALYIVIIPVIGLFSGKKQKWTLWLSVALALCGLYFLSIRGGFSFVWSDVLIIGCAFLFAGQMLAVEKYAGVTDNVKLSCIQFLVNAVLSAGAALIFEEVSLAGLLENIGPILFLGVFSSGIAYTLQIVAQRGSDTAVVSLLLCMESVFGVLGGAIFLKEVLTGREYLGCALMFAAVLLTEIPELRLRKRESR